MRSETLERERPLAIVRSSHGRSTAEALFNLSQTQRRLAHRYKREALQAEAEGNRIRYLFCRHEAERLWRDAKWHLNHVRDWRPSDAQED